MPDLSELRANCARLEVKYGPAVIVLFYRPAAFSGDTQDIIRGLDASANMDALWAEMERIIITWDLTTQGEVVPICPAGFKHAGMGIMGNIINAIGRAVGNPLWVPQPTIPLPEPVDPSGKWGTQTHSPNGSSQTDSLAAAQTTSSVSSTPNGPESLPGPWRAYPQPSDPSAGQPGSPTYAEPPSPLRMSDQPSNVPY